MKGIVRWALIENVAAENGKRPHPTRAWGVT